MGLPYEYLKESLDSQSPAMPVRILTGSLVIIFVFIWPPLGFIGLLVLFWLVYLTNYPEETDFSKANPDDIFAPMDGLITSIDATLTHKRIRISQQIFTNKLILMPCDGRIDINMFVDGLFMPAKIPNASSLNAKREIIINQDAKQISPNSNSDISLVLWGSPFARYLASPVLEGRKLVTGTPIAILLLHGEIDILLPLYYKLKVQSGDFCIARKTVLAESN